jgi:hypothetical protein
LATLAFLAACTPHYDWRDYRDADGFAATFPGKVQNATRSIDLDGLVVSMNMHAVRIDENAFVVGSVILPDPDAMAIEKAEDSVARGLVLNLAGVINRDEPVRIARLVGDAPSVAGREIEVTGQAQGRPLRMVARIAASGNHVYQIMVVGPAAEFAQPATREAIDTFLSSVRLQ